MDDEREGGIDNGDYVRYGKSRTPSIEGGCTPVSIQPMMGASAHVDEE